MDDNILFRNKQASENKGIFEFFSGILGTFQGFLKNSFEFVLGSFHEF